MACALSATICTEPYSEVGTEQWTSRSTCPQRACCLVTGKPATVQGGWKLQPLGTRAVVSELGIGKVTQCGSILGEQDCTHHPVPTPVWAEEKDRLERSGADRGDRVGRVCSSWVAPSEHVFLRSAPRVPGSLDLHGTPCSWAALAELEAALRCSEAAAGHVGLDSEAVYTRHTHLEANSIQINKTLWEWDSKESSKWENSTAYFWNFYHYPDSLNNLCNTWITFPASTLHCF